MSSRKARGAATQALVAEHFRWSGWKYATDAGAGRKGKDILNTPGLAIEVKARREMDMLAGLRQAESNAEQGEIAAVVFRPDGYGPAKIGQWPVCVSLDTFILLCDMAGLNPCPYGLPPQ